MTLRTEYQAIASRWQTAWGNGETLVMNAISSAVAECEALADKPPKMLTYEDIDQIAERYEIRRNWRSFARAIEAAHIAKQKEPEVQKVKIYIYAGKDGPYATSYKYAQSKLIDSFEREVTLP